MGDVMFMKLNTLCVVSACMSDSMFTPQLLLLLLILLLILLPLWASVPTFVMLECLDVNFQVFMACISEPVYAHDRVITGNFVT